MFCEMHEVVNLRSVVKGDIFYNIKCSHSEKV